MDPITAIGLASGILTFITFSAGLVKGWKQIHETGSLEENATLEEVIGRIETLHSRLIPPDHDNKPLSGDAKDLCELAKDCQKVSDALLKLLGKMKSSDAARGIRAQWQNLSATWHSLVHEKDKLQLEEELSRCHQRLTAVLAFLTRKKLGQLEKLVRDNGEKFTQLQTNVRELNIELRKGGLDDETRGRIESLVSAQEQTIKKIGHERVLKSLEYSDMHKRRENIRQKLEEINEEENGTRVTFQWMLDRGEKTAYVSSHHNEKVEEDSNHSDDEKRIRDGARERFTNWLSTGGEDVFHISGKLGSGKSTLMQFLSDSPLTEKLLQGWAGDRRLVRANFFFSVLIGGDQQLLTGLRRTLIYEILKQCPEMTSEVLSQAWKAAISLPWQMDTTVDIRSKDVSAALHQIICRSHSSKTCFCFFIDGLDEFFDEDGLDKQDLVDLLNTWITDSNGNLKLCVASREEPEFKFSPETTLRLHDLTHHDMRRFVQKRLHGKVDSHIEKRLANIVPEKAQGIFLWVALVTRLIREEIKLGGSPEDILDQFPPGLRPLLDRTIDSIPEQHRVKAYFSFDMLLLLQNSSVMRSLPIFVYSFLEDYCKNPEFSKQETGPWEHNDDSSMGKRIGLAQTQLYGWCKGLLESRTDKKDGEYITFTHRSIREYLETDAIRQQHSRTLQHPHAGKALIQLLIAKVRSNILQRNWKRENNTTLTRLGLEQLLDSEPFEFLEILNSVLDKAASKKRPEHRSIYSYRVGIWTPLDYVFGEHDYSYPTWKLESDPTVTETISGVKDLICRFVGNGLYRLLGAPDLAFLDMLLMKARSHLQTNTRFFLDFVTHRRVRNMDQVDLSIWQHYLLTEIALRLVQPKSSLGTLTGSQRGRNFALISESFLKAGADPHISVTVAKLEDSEGRRSGWEDSESPGEEMNFEIGQEKTKVTIQFTKGDETEETDWPEEWREECKNWSLQDIVKRLEAPNKDAILELIDKNTRMLEDTEGAADCGKELEDSRNILEPTHKSNSGEIDPRLVLPMSISTENVLGFALGEPLGPGSQVLVLANIIN